MKRQTAMKEWRDVTRDAVMHEPGVPTSRTVHAFAQRVEELTMGKVRKLLADADVNLRELGACDNPYCVDGNCTHVRKRIADLLGHNAGGKSHERA